jgi:hypothetical protein
MPPAKDNRISLIVVVSGEDVPIPVNTHQKLREVMHKALNESGNQGQPLENWTLKSATGPLTDLDLTVAEAGLVDGAKLYLNPKAGEGGACHS